MKSKAFDPFTATEKEARSQPEADAVPHGAFWKWQAAQRIQKAQKQFQEEPLFGIAECFRAGLTVPKWLADSFLERFNQVKDAQAQSWDAAFGGPFRNKVQLRKTRQHQDRGLMDYLLHVGLLDQLFEGPRRLLRGKGLTRTNEEFMALGMRIGISRREIESLLSKTRKNLKKPLRRMIANSSAKAHDPFNMTKKSTEF